jgi:hypothetical protein
VAEAAINVALNPQFIAMKMASVAPTTESAPFIPHAQVTICGARELSSRIPAGIGIPSSIPMGTRLITATAIRAGREKGIAHEMNGVTRTIDNSPSTTIPTSAIAVLRCSVSDENRRLRAAPIPVPSSRENSVTVNEYTGWPSSSTKRCSTETSMSMKPAPSDPK